MIFFLISWGHSGSGEKVSGEDRQQREVVTDVPAGESLFFGIEVGPGESDIHTETTERRCDLTGWNAKAHTDTVQGEGSEPVTTKYRAWVSQDLRAVVIRRETKTR